MFPRDHIFRVQRKFPCNESSSLFSGRLLLFVYYLWLLYMYFWHFLGRFDLTLTFAAVECYHTLFIFNIYVNNLCAVVSRIAYFVLWKLCDTIVSSLKCEGFFQNLIMTIHTTLSPQKHSDGLKSRHLPC